MLAKTTLDDVAQRVGVSASTVSRVLSGARGVNEATRRKVLTAIRKLNYRSSVAHREQSESRLLGFLMPVEAERWGVRTNFTEQALNAISDVAAQSNYAAIVGSYNPTLGDRAEDGMLLRGDFAGALLFRTKDEIRDSEPFRKLNVPFLIVNRLLPETSLNYIGPDHFKAGYTAAEHLLQCGYRRVGLLSGKVCYASHRLYQSGFEQAHADAGVPVKRNLITEIELNAEGGYAGAAALLEQRERPDALVVTGDRPPLGALKALSDKRVKVPLDIGMVALDGTREAAFANPPLTAVEIPWYDMLAMGARLLIDVIENRPPVQQIGVSYSTQLVVRESTARLNGRFGLSKATNSKPVRKS